MAVFNINGKTYKAKPFTYNLVSELEEMGISMESFGGSKAISSVRAYFALCAGLTKEEAGEELEKHMISGGKLKDLTMAMNKEMEDSDFFRSLKEAAAATDQENQSETIEKE